MKKIKHFSKAIALSLLLAFLLPTVIGAALPPIVSPQYNNVYEADCGFDFSQANPTIWSYVQGKSGATINAKLTLYLVVLGRYEVEQVSYNYTATSSLSVSEVYVNFAVGSIYKLKLTATVTYNGVSETVTDEVTVMSP